MRDHAFQSWLERVYTQNKQVYAPYLEKRLTLPFPHHYYHRDHHPTSQVGRRL